MTGPPSGRPDAESLTSLLSDRPQRRFRRGARLYHEGDPPSHAFVVHRGLVKLMKTTDEGVEALVEFRGSGHFVGECATIDGLPRSTTAVAATETCATPVSRVDLTRHLCHDADLAMAMISSLSDAWRHSVQHLLDLMVGDAVALVAARLLQLAEDPIFASVREERNGTIVIEMPMSQRELASWAGVSQRSATGVLGYLRERGHISTSRLHVEVHDPSALAEHCVTRPPRPADAVHV